MRLLSCKVALFASRGPSDRHVARRAATWRGSRRPVEPPRQLRHVVPVRLRLVRKAQQTLRDPLDESGRDHVAGEHVPRAEGDPEARASRWQRRRRRRQCRRGRWRRLIVTRRARGGGGGATGCLDETRRPRGCVGGSPGGGGGGCGSSGWCGGWCGGRRGGRCGGRCGGWCGGRCGGRYGGRCGGRCGSSERSRGVGEQQPASHGTLSAADG